MNHTENAPVITASGILIRGLFRLAILGLIIWALDIAVEPVRVFNARVNDVKNTIEKVENFVDKLNPFS